MPTPERMNIQQAMAAAMAHQQAGRLGEAQAIYRQILAADPNHADALHLLGATRLQSGQFAMAEELIGRAIAAHPGAAQFHTNLGLALAGQNRLDEAIATHQRAVSIDPRYANGYFHLGNALQAAARIHEAVAAFSQAAAIQPSFADAFYNLGNALTTADRADEAIAAYRRALAIQPRYPTALGNLASALHQTGQFATAIAEFARAIAMAPDYAEAHHNLALTLLLLGDFDRGWAEYEWRLKLPGAAGESAGPVWDGSALNGRTLLIRAEQGFGDAIQFARYLPILAAQGARVVLECKRELIRLFQSLPGSVEFAIKGDPLPRFDAHCRLLSLPRIFRTRLETIPASLPYLRADQEMASRWRKRLTSDTFNVGVAWAGRSAHTNDRNRSMPMSALAPLAKLPGVRLVSLQKDAPPTSTDPFPLTDWISELNDFADTAALIDNLDLVITVDTAVAHLAGAMGKPVWLLLPFVPDWRWMLGRDNSPWYPTMRLFRQPRPKDWSSVIDQVVHALNEYLQRGLATDNYNRALELWSKGEPERAIGMLRAAVARQSQFPEAHYNLGKMLQEMGETGAAIAEFEEALEQRPDFAEAHCNLGNAQRGLGRYDKAIDSYQEAVKARPDWASAHYNLGVTLLLKGDWASGWAEYEWRRREPEFGYTSRTFNVPRWRGEDLTGKRILLHIEQGYGDIVQLVRYVPLVAQRGAKTILECPPALARLMGTLAGVDQLVTDYAAVPPYDLECPLPSLPGVFQTTLETIPAGMPYLRADADLSSRWRRRMTTDGLRVGLCWAGKADHQGRRIRSLSLAAFEDLTDVSDAEFFSLQKGDGAVEADLPPSGLRLTNWADELADFADTAALIDNLDLVITIDTAVAHLAGAMGKPVWVLLLFDPDWRWMLDRTDSPWYPSMKLFRQPEPGNWQAAIARVVQELKCLK